MFRHSLCVMHLLKWWPCKKSWVFLKNSRNKWIIIWIHTYDLWNINIKTFYTICVHQFLDFYFWFLEAQSTAFAFNENNNSFLVFNESLHPYSVSIHPSLCILQFNFWLSIFVWASTSTISRFWPRKIVHRIWRWRSNHRSTITSRWCVNP